MQTRTVRQIATTTVRFARTAAAAILLVAAAGCSVFGIARREPMLVVRDDAVSLAPGADMRSVVLQAAGECKWSAKDVAPGVMRCSISARMWNMEVDVRYAGSAFSIDYVSSEGLFYYPERHAIHPQYNRQVEKLRQRIKRLAPRAAVLNPPVVAAAPAQTTAGAVPTAAVAAPVPAAPAPVAKPYSIEKFERAAGDGFSYNFVLALTDAGAADLSLSRTIQADLREAVRADYVAATAAADAASLRIEFPPYAIKNGKVEGRAEVLTVQLQEFVYDPVTAQGRLAVKVDPRQYDATRRWVHDNIATLARDKNKSFLDSLAGTTRFTIGREVLRDDNVLEVEFHAGERR